MFLYGAEEADDPEGAEQGQEREDIEPRVLSEEEGGDQGEEGEDEERLHEPLVVFADNHEDSDDDEGQDETDAARDAPAEIAAPVWEGRPRADSPRRVFVEDLRAEQHETRNRDDGEDREPRRPL